MKFIKLEEFLKLFRSKSITLKEFLKVATVKIGNKTKPLSEYMEDKKIKMEDIELLFENIEKRDEYLTRFFNMSLRIDPQRLHFTDVQPMKNKHMNNNEESLYKNLIRNIHMMDILQNTKSGIENIPTFLDMLFDLYLRQIIDYKILTPSSLFYMKKRRLGSVFSSYYFRASIMNPYLVFSLNESVLKGTRIFTPTLGWTSYCYGFLESPGVIEYVGTDVIPSVCKKTQELGNAYSQKATIDIYCKPSEDLYASKAFLTKYREHFDVVFFSPPYYRLELYDGKDQSTERYKTYEEWLAGYWEKTILLSHAVLQKGGKLCYILSGYGSENTKEKYDLLGDMNKITRKHFRAHSTQPMYNKNVHVTKHKETQEQIMLFVKN